MSPAPTLLNRAAVLINAATVSSCGIFVLSSLPFLISDILGRPDTIGRDLALLTVVGEVTTPMYMVWGLLCDRLGPRYVAFIGYIMLSITMLLLPHSQNLFPDFMIADLLLTFTSSAILTMVTASLAELSLGSAQGRFVGVVSFVQNVSTVGASVLLLPLPVFLKDKYGMTQADGLRWVYLGLFGYSLFLAVLSLLIMYQNPKKRLFKQKTITDEESTSLLADGETSSAAAPLGALQAVVQGVKFCFQDRQIMLACVTNAVGYSLNVGFGSFMPVLIMRIFKQNGVCGDSDCSDALLVSSKLLGIFASTNIVAGLLYGYLIDRFGVRKTMSGAIVLGLTGTLMFASIVDAQGWLPLLSTTLYALGFTGLSLSALTLCTDTSRDSSGVIAAVFHTITEAGNLSVFVIGGLLADIEPGYVFALLSSFYVIVVIALVASRPKP